MTMTRIGFHLYLRNRNKAKQKLISDVSLNAEPSGKKLELMMSSPAQAIKAMTAGRRAFRIVWMILRFLYLK